MRELPLVMPKMSMTMEEGQVLAWHKSVGDVIHAGDIVCEVMTDKVNMDVEASIDGTITRIVVEQGQAAAVGEPMAFVATESEDLLEGLTVGPQPAQAEATPEASVARLEQPTADQVARPPSRKGRVAAAPLARRRAAELGVDLASITGTGVGGAITKKDVEAAANSRLVAASRESAPAQAEPVRIQPSAQQGTSARPTESVADSAEISPAFADALAAHRSAVRQAVAKKMTESAAIPQFTAYAEIDVQALGAVRGRVGWTSLLIYAVARSLRDHPVLNGAWQDGAATPSEHVGVALAVDTPIGLVAPVISDPDLAAIDEVDARVRRLIEQARSGRLAGDALAGATFTLSNLGGFGVRSFQALITPPQVAALSVGAIGEHPVGRNGALSVRTTCSVGLTVDHRAADGADAGRFLSDLSALLGAPEQLLRPRSQHSG